MPGFLRAEEKSDLNSVEIAKVIPTARSLVNYRTISVFEVLFKVNKLSAEFVPWLVMKLTA